MVSALKRSLVCVLAILMNNQNIQKVCEQILSYPVQMVVLASQIIWT